MLYNFIQDFVPYFIPHYSLLLCMKLFMYECLTCSFDLLGSGPKLVCFDELRMPGCPQKEKDGYLCSKACIKKYDDGQLLNVFCETDGICLCRYVC